MAGEHAGHRQRMRERFLQNGLDGFAEHEILELLLFYAIPQRNVNPLAHQVLERFGSLNGVLEAPVEELMKVEGVGQYAAAFLQLVGQTARKVELNRHPEREKLELRKDVKEHCRRLLEGLRHEEFYVVCLDAQCRVLQDACVAKGTLSEVQAYPRLVAEAALRHNAHSVILCHNHPSGSVVPSLNDIEVTRVLINLLLGMEVVVLDHVVTAGKNTLSMVETGLIQFHEQTKELRAADSGDAKLIRARLERQMKMQEFEETP